VGAAAGGIAVSLSGSGIRFLFDENIPAVFATALRLVGYQAYSNEDVGLRSALDPQVIEFCAVNHLVWVTNDLDARKKAGYAAQVRNLGVSAVFLKSPRAKGWSSKEQFEVLARNLRTLETRYQDHEPRFFLLRAAGQPREVSSFAARPGR
jgi:predicted nuclease of predicted toxin-antitoxin system